MDWKEIMMMNMDEIEKTIKNLRVQATQLNTTADALETWITPWRNAQNMISETQKTMQQFMPPWFKP
jgi:exonuclease VII small subunit